MPDYDVELDGNSDQHHWSCRYSALSVKDSNQETGWSEGVRGDGIGEILIVPVDTSQNIRIWAGFGKTKQLFLANNRPRKVRVFFLDARTQMATQFGLIYSDIKIVGSNTQTLRDHYGFQSLGRPKHIIQGRSLIAIEILSVYRGTRWRDTVISEILH